MASRVVLPESKLKLNRRKKRLWLLWISSTALVVLVGGSIALLWVSAWRITTVTVTGTETVSPEAITDIANKDLAGAYSYVFPKNNVLLYPKQAITKDISSAFPVLSNISLGLGNLHTLNVTVTERTPSALWCGEEIGSTDSCYLLDPTGLAYAGAYSGTGYTQYYGSIATGTLPWQYLSKSQFQSLAALSNAIDGAAKGDAITTVSVTSDGEVHIGFGSGFMLLFLLNQNPSDVLNRFSLALTSDVFTSHSLSDFEYLDLRFGDKLYYKLKGQ